MKHVFIMNDTKKNHDFEEVIHKVMKDYEYEIIYTHSLKEVYNCIKSFKEKTRVYSVGGDGSISGVMQALVNTYHELVPIPLGTGNDFIRQLTDKKDPEEILRSSLNAEVEKIDCIKMNDQYYINTACFGVDSVIGTHVHDVEDIPFVPKSQSYIVSILKHVFKFDFGEVELHGDGQLLYKGNITVLTINNGQYYGGGFMITPQADMKDGYMDIVVCDQVPKSKIPGLFLSVLRKTHLSKKQVKSFKVKEAYLKTMNSGNLDGEEVPVVGEYHFSVIPESINLVMYK